MKQIMKIRLRKDGTWENVYDDLSNEMLVKMQSKLLSEIASDYLDQAVEASGYRDANAVINHIKGLK
jgi:hypothetical protein